MSYFLLVEFITIMVYLAYHGKISLIHDESSVINFFKSNTKYSNERSFTFITDNPLIIMQNFCVPKFIFTNSCFVVTLYYVEFYHNFIELGMKVVKDLALLFSFLIMPYHYHCHQESIECH